MPENPPTQKGTCTRVTLKTPMPIIYTDEDEDYSTGPNCVESTKPVHSPMTITDL